MLYKADITLLYLASAIYLLYIAFSLYKFLYRANMVFLYFLLLYSLHFSLFCHIFILILLHSIHQFFILPHSDCHFVFATKRNDCPSMTFSEFVDCWFTQEPRRADTHPKIDPNGVSTIVIFGSKAVDWQTCGR